MSKPSERIYGYCPGGVKHVPGINDVRREMDALHERLEKLEKGQTLLQQIGNNIGSCPKSEPKRESIAEVLYKTTNAYYWEKESDVICRRYFEEAQAVKDLVLKVIEDELKISPINPIIHQISINLKKRIEEL